MKEVTILDKRFREYIAEDKIEKRIRELASEIDREMKGKEVMFLGILNGAFLFAADLFKRMEIPCRITFLKLASYQGTQSSGTIKELIGWNEDVSGKTVIVLEDIIDTGGTLERIVGELELRKAGEIKVATLLFKPEAYTKGIKIDYIGFSIPNEFVVGYGLDYDGYGRNLPSIYSIVE